MTFRSRFLAIPTEALLKSILIALISITVFIYGSPPSTADASANTMYWGAWVHSEAGESPFSMGVQNTFEERVGKTASLIHWSSPWFSSGNCGGFCNFQTTYFNNVRSHGSIPFFSWAPGGVSSTDKEIAEKKQDSYIKKWAEEAEAWGHPFFLRFAWEMNGSWFRWGQNNAETHNTAEDYVKMWKHVHDIFTEVGASNVTWVWCPNVESSKEITEVAPLYPGDSYVNWTCLDGYNGDDPSWQSFSQLFSGTYKAITGSVAPSKPMLIGETASTESGGSKAQWITDMFSSLPSEFPMVRGVAWFDKINEEGPGGHEDWPIESSTSATTAFATGIQGGPFQSAGYGSLSGPPTPPAATSEGATEIESHQAKMNGSISANGNSVKYHFEIGTSTAYGTNVPIPDAEPGVYSGAVAKTASGLKPETTYHFRVVATSAAGTTYGADTTFKTKPATPLLVSSIGATGSGEGQFNYPMGMAVDSSGNVWVADHENNRIEKFNSEGKFLMQFGSTGSGNGQFKKPIDIAITSGGDLWVTDYENYRVQEFDSEGKYLTQFGSYGVGENGKFTEPWGIAIGPNGHLWISDHRYYRIEEFNAGGEFVRSVGSGYGNAPLEFNSPSGIAIDQEGRVWIADMGNNRIQELSSTGGYLGQFGTGGTGPGELDEPMVLGLTTSGNIWIAERGTSRVQRFSPSGEYLAQFSLGGNPESMGIATAPGGNIYVSNTRENKIERWVEPAPPIVATESASNVRTTEASLNGTVNPHGLSTTYHFEYGKNTSYGTNVPSPSQSVGSGADAVANSKTISGLSPETTYHFRIISENSEGATYGKDSTFTTLGTGGALNAMAVTEPFDGSSNSISNFSANWSALGWASGGSAKGEDSASGWHSVGAYPTVNGAFYGSTLTDAGPGIAGIAIMAVNPANASRYFSLWLDMSSPSSTRAGYELRFTNVSSGTYNIALSRWQEGSQTVLASRSSYSFANGNSFALVDKGGTVSAWTNTGSGFSQLLSASDTTFEGGKAAVEGAGNITRLTNFKAGSL